MEGVEWIIWSMTGSTQYGSIDINLNLNSPCLVRESNLGPPEILLVLLPPLEQRRPV